MHLGSLVRDRLTVWLQVTLLSGWLACFACAQTSVPLAQAAPTGELRHGRELLMSKQFPEAKIVFSAYLKAHPGDVQAELGVGDAQLGMHEYEPAEATYRAITAQQPQLWQAHKNLVVVEAALGRWEDFDRERMVLRMARQRGASGISTRESDVIDSFNVRGQHWVVRAYFEPVGRSQARYNFERFSAEGRVQAYVSLEDPEAAEAALQPGDVRVGGKGPATPANSQGGTLALNWYTGTAHGTVRSYPSGEPPYQRMRADVIHWIEMHPAATGETGPSKEAVPGPASGKRSGSNYETGD